MTMKIKRKCVICKQEFMANRYHELDDKSMSEALVCKKHREDYINHKKSR